MLATELAQLFQQNEFEKICSYFNQPDGLKPSDDPISCHIYAASLFQLGNYSLCLELLNTLQSSMGDSIDSLYCMVRLCEGLGNLKRLYLFLANQYLPSRITSLF